MTAAMRIIGVLLIAAGLVTLAYRGFSYTTRDKVIDAGPIEVTKTDRNWVSIPPLVSGIVLVLGAGLLWGSTRGQA